MKSIKVLFIIFTILFLSGCIADLDLTTHKGIITHKKFLPAYEETEDNYTMASPTIIFDDEETTSYPKAYRLTIRELVEASEWHYVDHKKVYDQKPYYQYIHVYVNKDTYSQVKIGQKYRPTEEDSLGRPSE